MFLTKSLVESNRCRDLFCHGAAESIILIRGNPILRFKVYTNESSHQKRGITPISEFFIGQEARHSFETPCIRLLLRRFVSHLVLVLAKDQLD